MHTQRSKDKSDRDRDRLLAEIRKHIERQIVEDLYKKLEEYYEAPKLCYKVHEREANVEYLVSPDLSDLGAGEPLSGTLEERARQFLLVKHGLFGFSDQQRFGSLLYLEHTLRSQMGTHCIFKLRIEGIEVIESCFIVHLDHSGRVIMVTSVYQPDMPLKVAPAYKDWSRMPREFLEVDKVAGWDYEGLKKRLRGLVKKSQGVRAEPVLVPNYEEGKYEPRLQVKLRTLGADFVFLYTDDGERDQNYLAHAGAAPGQMVLGRVYRDFWSPKQQSEPEDAEKVMERDLKTVVLRDLQSNLELVGRYVAVRDEIYPHYWQSLGSDHLLIEKAQLTSSWIDRMMAYYHIDLIQRHFRELGLEVLDEYPQFNPMHVEFDENKETRYAWYEERIYLGRLSRKYHCTDAREARIVYHEFVHAVTDALARLNRQDKKAKGKPRCRQILQAAAMDEGLADYFACSLAARQGVRRAYFYPTAKLVVKQHGNKVIERPKPRYLGTMNGEAREYNLGIVYDPKQDLEPEIVYKWGEQWGRYLWKLRCMFGAEIADTVIAHSIFFLTRWATFDMGVLALMLADRLLFEGIHESDILKAGEDARDWSEIPPKHEKSSPLGGKEAV